MCDAIRPPIDLPPMKSGTPGSSARAASTAARHARSSTCARSGTCLPAVIYGKSNVAVITPRPPSPVAVRTMNGVPCPPPPPCATTRPAIGDSLRYTFNPMRISSIVTAVLLLSATGAAAQRLPAHVAPIHYDVAVTPNLAAATFAGQETIRVRLARPSATIVLNAVQVTVRNVEI